MSLRLLLCSCFLIEADRSPRSELNSRSVLRPAVCLAADGVMPEEAPRVTNRWEGTHTYKKPEAEKKRARTVAQLREEAAAKTKANREESINKRRGSITGASVQNAVKVAEGRRLSTGAIGSNRASIPPSIENPEEIILSDDDTAQTSEMTGSNKKKRHASAKPDATSDGVDKDLKAFLIAMKDDINQATNAAVDRIDKRIDDNARQIGEIKQDLERRDASIAAKISTEVRQEVAKLGASLKGKSADELPAGTQSRRDKAYNYCRRTLKIWPIKGEDLEDEVRNFLSSRLKFDQAKIESLGAIEVKHSPARQAKEKGEVLATFETKEDRDIVKGGGISLAGDREAGMSIHVPGHLMDNLMALNGIGYNIKTKYNGVKRAVKFDDVKQDIFLDICINGNWKRITPVKARAVMEKIPAGSGPGSLSLSFDDLSNLVQGEAVAGLTAVVVPGDEEDQAQ